MRGCRAPAVYEPGEKTIPLEAGQFDLEIQGPAVVLHAWSLENSLVRRIVGVLREDRTELVLAIRRLGKGERWIEIRDLARARPDQKWQESRLAFRERFRRILSREFGDFEIAQISAAHDLEHSLSPVYARAFLTRGQQSCAALGLGEEADPGAADHMLAFGLIWLDYLRAREPQRVVESLKLVLPRKRSTVTANRLAFLDSARARCELYEYGPEGSLARVDEKNYGNLSTKLDPAAAPLDPAPPAAEWIDRLCGRFGVERVGAAGAGISLRLRGLEFARVSGSEMTFGLWDDRRPVTAANYDRVERLAEQLAAARSVEARDKQDWLYRVAPERWLESLVRANVTRVDSSLSSEPLYSQVPAVAGADRSIIDLLAVDHAGRLAVLELKAAEDPHLPLQGLDYWMRVKWHLDRGEFQSQGYFRGIEISPRAPRLLLVAPAFDFHSTTETILRHFSPEIEVERVGLGLDWRRELKVVFRARGAARPGVGG